MTDQASPTPKARRKRVLVLTASDKPISTTTAVRARALGENSRATVIAYAKSAHGSMEEPAVIRLNRLVEDFAWTLGLTRQRIFRRDKMTCQYCGEKKSLKSLTLDHVLPKSRGGQNTWENLVAACHDCNIKKADRTPEEAAMPLLSIPCKPDDEMGFRISIEGDAEVLQNWLAYAQEAQPTDVCADAGAVLPPPS